MTHLFLAAIPVFLLLVPNVYAGGPRYDSPEGENDFTQLCYRDGYETGFVHIYNKDRANECEEDGKDWYNITWMNACKDSGQTVQDCENIKDENQSNEEINNDDVGNENMDTRTVKTIHSIKIETKDVPITKTCIIKGS